MPQAAPPPPAAAVSLPPVPRVLQALLCVMTLVWAVAAQSIARRAASGLAARFGVEPVRETLAAAFLLFLFAVGTRALDAVATRGRFAVDILPLPARPTRLAEWGTGAAIGWGLAVVATLPLLLTAHLHGSFGFSAGTLTAGLLSLLTLALLALAEEAVFRGYAFRRLAAAVGETAAALLLASAFAALTVALAPPGHVLAAWLNGLLLGLLLALAWWRTHALWAGWGLHFAYRAAMGVLLGLPVLGRSLAGPAQLAASGPRWLSGGSFGLDAALPTEIALLLAMAVLYRATRDFAWAYTHRPIVAGGYEVAVAPPAAHTAMERAAAAAPPSLVQILPSTPREARVPGRPDDLGT